MPDHERALEILGKMQARAEAATSGPWTMDETRHHSQNQQSASASVERMEGGRTVATATITAWKQGHKDARPDCRFIAAARSDVPKLCAALRGALFVHEPIEARFTVRTHGTICKTDRRNWPCPTVRAIREALGESE